MNVSYTLHNIRFEWDSTKASGNLRKHRVTFEIACEVFFDPFLHAGDDKFVDNELRETVIGMTTSWHLLVVAYTLRSDVIRLISARPATRAERTSYENR